MDFLQENIEEVFNDYNINILFTTHSLRCKVSMASLGGLKGLQFGNENERKAAINQAAKVQFEHHTPNTTAGFQKAIIKAAVHSDQEKIGGRRNSEDATRKSHINSAINQE